MLISLVHTFTCSSCGQTRDGVMVQPIRVNKGSLKPTGAGLGFMPRECSACGKALPDEAAVTVADDDRPKVNAARVKRGWPELTDWRVASRTTTPAVPETQETAS